MTCNDSLPVGIALSELQAKALCYNYTMHKTSLHNSNRFQDPLGDYMKAALDAKRQHLERYPDVREVYQGFYARFYPLGKDGANFLSSAEGIIGSELDLRRVGSGLGFFAYDGRQISALEDTLANKLIVLADAGWTIRCLLAYTLFETEKKTFSAQFACFCLGPGLSEDHMKALENFIHNMTDRIASASHPGLGLSQEQFVKVLESGGEWFLAKDEPWPELPKGTVYYRRRRTFNDRLIGAALKGNKGCSIASWIAAVLIVAAIAFAIWHFFF